MTFTQSTIDIAIVWHFCYMRVNGKLKVGDYIVSIDRNDPWTFQIQDSVGSTANYKFMVTLETHIGDTVFLQKTADYVKANFRDAFVHPMLYYFITIFAHLCTCDGAMDIIAGYPCRARYTPEGYACFVISTADGLLPVSLKRCMNFATKRPAYPGLLYTLCRACPQLPYSPDISVYPMVSGYSDEELKWCKEAAPKPLLQFDDEYIVRCMHTMYKSRG